MPTKRGYTRRNSKRALARYARQNVPPPPASSLKSNTTSTLRTTTSNLSTSSKHSSFPSRQKITKRIKLDITSTSENSNSNVPMNGYTILQNQMLFSLMCKTNCQSCKNRWNGEMNINKREGLFVILSFQCLSCNNTITIETSPKVVASDRRDINIRSQIGGHLYGIRYAGLAKLMGAMNLPSPIQDQIHSKWDKNLLLSIKSFSNRSMTRAVNEAVTAANGRELMVSGDGFWQTRDFQSRHGAAALLSCNTTPKVLDIETCSKTCNVCMGALAIKKSNPVKYNDVIRSHKCEKNYNKSSGTIEADAVLNMFKRSVSKYGIYYTSYVGDGDSKTFASLSNAKPYPAVRNGTPYDHTPHALPHPVLDAIKPVFENLCFRESLARVVDASSQNQNEGFHSLVWLMSPKHKTTSGTTFETAFHLVIILFNDGYFTLGDLFNNICGYRGHYTNQAMIHFDNSRLHSESKTNNRKTRKEADRGVQKNVDNDQTNNNNAPGDDNDKTINSDKQTDDDYNETNSDNQPTSEDNDTTTDSDECITDDRDSTSSSDDSSTDSDDKTILSLDTKTNEDIERNDGTSDNEYGYYNPKDRRRWKEEE
ncbi:unnamed protein product [Rotaria sordida]|uniref:Mutator-like transposase domain-containing protein n=1 Tax=Rotaria sordida TaxID=392033 RepID=A0A814SZH8_9BILA|nr:unnamed protein product [Rotaria sordida]CAF1400700.1 unnamed protein product [Rotaria sordida]